MLDGTLCEHCGTAIEGEAPGYPRYCSRQCARKAKPAPVLKVGCPHCGKRIRPNGIHDHIRDTHHDWSSKCTQ